MSRLPTFLQRIAQADSSARQNLFGPSEGAPTRKNLPLHQACPRPLGPSAAKTLEICSLLPKSLIAPFLRSQAELTVERLPAALKAWRFRIEDYKGFDRAVVTAGGVSLKEIVPKTMASRLRPGLYFCGEVLDLDGDTGGYNLQIAFSTGALAGTNAAYFLLSSQN